uniref:G-type lectin S-receptor-like serine/threonine-protein kinase At4g27290 n=1 Tax=Erigeron canadensis TaxID=72917 RepID=UPI001CB97161|nr:G-type lectin S-receptor-like serine/threonine-protein kinase At4g27290 [Erigeron canadensis]
MKFGKDFVRGIDKYLTSWKSVDDPSIGEYTNRFDYNGYPQVFLRKGSEVKHRSGPWNGLRFSGMPNLKPNDIYTFGFEFNEKEIYYKYELFNKSVVSRMILTPAGLIQRLIWVERTKEWVVYVTGQMDDCDRYGLCGPNGICNINNSPACGCWNGFEPKFSEEWGRADWSNGCTRRVELNCSRGDGFVKHSNVKLPDTRKTWFNVSMNLEECEKECRKSCNCTAYANLDVMTGTGCLIWSEDLVDIRTYAENGQDIYVRMAAAELCKSQFHPISSTWQNGWEADWELPLFDFNTLANATNNFSHSCKLGEGGYGAVYKGMLEDGKEIAVKRHSRESNQGLDEFMNEVQCIAKLQHRNLVKLLGCCIEEGERMLIYEYMPNLSLNYFIFDEGKRKSLDWSNRYSIIIGIARGLLYLHQDSRLRIIHRDLKASNILLDKDMNPRISDFGLARSMEGSITKGNTRRVMGTYGYMAPEYTIDGIYSIKSDVFSFGVLVLEIVSGKKNRGFHHTDHDLNLLGHAWRLYQEGKQLELIDGTIKDSYVQSQVNRAIHIGLLCVQKYPEVRPDMPMVVLMLASEIPLPEPVEPGFFTERKPHEGKSPSTNQSSYNHISITYVQPR